MDTEHVAVLREERLKGAREYLGISQEFVAEKLGIPRTSISAFENGKRKVSATELKQLASLYKVSLEYFYGADQFAADPVFIQAMKGLSEEDMRQVLRFAEFLKQAGKAPKGKLSNYP